MALGEEKDGVTEGTHIHFRYIGVKPGCLTATWHIMAGKPAENGAMLGHVAWYGAWRRYCFFPNGATVFEEVCLREIAEFLVWQTSKYKSSGRRGDTLASRERPNIRP